MNLMHGTASQLKAVVMATEVEETTKPDTTIAGTVKVEKQGMSLLQWVGVVGVGSALLIYAVPKIMKQDAANQAFIQTKMFDTVTTAATAMTTSAAALDELGDNIGHMVQQQNELTQAVQEQTETTQELADDLAPLINQLDRVANAVQEQTEQQSQEPQP